MGISGVKLAKENRVEAIKKLYEMVYRQKSQSDAPAYNKLRNEMEKDGYKFEQAWGHYLHCPDGTTITLDYWND